jgi:hypothetical protein
LPPLSATNHNGGAIHFGQGEGEENKLYVAVGEDARPSAAQALNSLLGKMLRINKEPNSISTDNPFCTQTTGNSRAIWALGLRNPYSFDVQPETGRTFINDVEQRVWKEINDGIPGVDYWWPLYEGLTGTHHFVRRGSVGTRSVADITAIPSSTPTRTVPVVRSPAALSTIRLWTPTHHFRMSMSETISSRTSAGVIARYDIATDTATSFASGAGEFPVDLKMGSKGDLFFLARNPGSFEKISYTPTP